MKSWMVLLTARSWSEITHFEFYELSLMCFLGQKVLDVCWDTALMHTTYLKKTTREHEISREWSVSKRNFIQLRDVTHTFSWSLSRHKFALKERKSSYRVGIDVREAVAKKRRARNGWWVVETHGFYHQANPHVHQQHSVLVTTFRSGLPQPLSSQKNLTW